MFFNNLNKVKNISHNTIHCRPTVPSKVVDMRIGQMRKELLELRKQQGELAERVTTLEKELKITDKICHNEVWTAKELMEENQQLKEQIEVLTNKVNKP